MPRSGEQFRLDALGGAVHPDAFTKREFREILDEADRLRLEPIPLLQTFGHAEYVLTRGKFGAYLFPALAELHTEERVRDIRACGIDFMLWNVSAADRHLLDRFLKYGLGCVVGIEGAPGWGGGTGSNVGTKE